MKTANLPLHHALSSSRCGGRFSSKSFLCKLKRFWLTKHCAWRESPGTTVFPSKDILHQIRHEEWERRKVGILASLECPINASKSCRKCPILQLPSVIAQKYKLE